MVVSLHGIDPTQRVVFARTLLFELIIYSNVAGRQDSVKDGVTWSGLVAPDPERYNAKLPSGTRQDAVFTFSQRGVCRSSGYNLLVVLKSKRPSFVKRVRMVRSILMQQLAS